MPTRGFARNCCFLFQPHSHNLRAWKWSSSSSTAEPVEQMVDVVRYTSIPSYWKNNQSSYAQRERGWTRPQNSTAAWESSSSLTKVSSLVSSSFSIRKVLFSHEQPPPKTLKILTGLPLARNETGKKSYGLNRRKRQKPSLYWSAEQLSDISFRESDRALSWELCAFLVLKLLKLYASRSNGFQTTFGGHADRVSQMRHEAAVRAWSTQTRSRSHFTGAAIGRPTIWITSGRLAPGDIIRPRVRMRVCAQDTWERLEEAWLSKPKPSPPRRQRSSRWGKGPTVMS